MARLLRRELPRRNYVQLIHNLQAIYAALEPALSRRAASPALTPLLLPCMFRAEELSGGRRRRRQRYSCQEWPKRSGRPMAALGPQLPAA